MKDYKEIIIEYIKNNISRILSLLDRKRYSQTYGCFDREYWHYKSKDFFNGMNQCYVLSLTLLYTTDFKGNYLYKNQNLRQLIIAVLKFSINNTYRDGSFDEHYKNEHSIAATSFALYCITESMILMEFNDKPFKRYFTLVSKFLIKNQEYYIRSNHIACTLLAISNIFTLTNDIKYFDYTQTLLDKLLKYRSNEGWFMEYNGCDLGYLTFTLNFLSKFAIRTKNTDLIQKLKETVFFCAHFMHPDGSYGGFYGSRENMHFLPLGFELLENDNAIGKKMVDSFLNAVHDGNAEIISDDRFNFLLFNDLLEIYKILPKDRAIQQNKFIKESKLFEDAGIFVYHNVPYYAVLSLKKGGVIYIYKNNRLFLRNCGLIAKTRKGFITSTGFEGVKSFQIKNGFKISGKFKKYPQNNTISPFKNIFFLLYNIFLGNFSIFRRLLKKSLIKSFILKEKNINVNFTMEIIFLDKISIKILISNNKKIIIDDLYLSNFLPLKYIPSSQFFQKQDLIKGDINLKQDLLNLNKEVDIKIEIK